MQRLCFKLTCSPESQQLRICICICICKCICDSSSREVQVEVEVEVELRWSLPAAAILVLLLLVFRSEVLPAKPSQAKLEVKSAFDFAEILDSLFADFISQNSNMLAVSRGRCNFRLYWSLLACLQLLSHSAIQPFSYARYFCLKTTITATKHLDTASNHAFACKFASHRWRNMPGICMQIYLLDATRLETWVLHRFRYCHRSVLLHSSLPPICQSVSYRMTYCKYMYIITHTHAVNFVVCPRMLIAFEVCSGPHRLSHKCQLHWLTSFLNFLSCAQQFITQNCTRNLDSKFDWETA